METSQLEANMEAEENKGKRKRIEIKKVEQPNRRHVTFSKRKLGLFNKLTELSILCQTEIALLVTSQNGKHFTCGYPNADSVIRRYLTAGPPPRDVWKKQTEVVEALRLEYEAVQSALQDKKRRLKEITEREQSAVTVGLHPWWKQGIEEMSLENLEEFKASLQLLKLNLLAAVQEGRFGSLPPPMPLPLAVFSQQHLSMPNASLLTQGHVPVYRLGNGASTTSSAFGTFRM